MYLSKISIVGFRNLNGFTIDLRPGLNVILGANNIGKTNLLDALRLALTTAYGADHFASGEIDQSSWGFSLSTDLTASCRSTAWGAVVGCIVRSSFACILNLDSHDVNPGSAAR